MSHNYIITDAMPGVEYLVQLKSKDEYDGLWGAWSTPAYGSTWIGKYTCPHIHTFMKKIKSKSRHFKNRFTVDTTDSRNFIQFAQPEKVPCGFRSMVNSLNW